jgi:hypothetical protein
MCYVGTAEIEAAFDGQMSFVLDLLRNHFAENDLLSEIFAADHNSGTRGAAGQD